MSVELIEVVTSREFSTSATSASGTWKYTARVTGEADPEAALADAVAADAPFFWYGLARKDIKGTPLGGDLYEVEVSYTWEVPNSAAPDPVSGGGAGTGPGGGSPSSTPAGPASDAAPLGVNVSLEIGGRPPKLMRSYAVTNPGEKVGGGDAPDHKGTLGVTEDKKVEGFEVPDPASVLNIDVNFDFISVAFINLLTAAVWKVNLSDWYFIPAGCAAFMGCTLTSGDNGRVKGAFKFGLNPAKTVAIGELRNDGVGFVLPTVAVDVRGWDLFEVEYGDEIDSGAGVMVKPPTAWRLHSLLPSIAFSTLGLGG